MKRLKSTVVATLVPLFLGCQAHAQQCPIGSEDRARSAARPGERESQRVVLEGGEPKGTAPAESPAALPEGAAAAADPASESAKPSPKDGAPGSGGPSEKAQSLPELKVKLMGMHVGGGPNDSVTKRPFIEAIEGGFQAMRACYRDAEEPMKGGSFGVDLRVSREGGHPVVQAVRTVMKGDKMRTCLQEAFAGTTFVKPEKGDTVLSVSVHFSLGDGA